MIEKKYKRGDKHPTQELLFWQYHGKDYKKTNGEYWVTYDKYKEKVLKDQEATRKQTLTNQLKYIVNSAVSRDKKRYNTPKEDLIDYMFIKSMLKKQDNKCFWFNIELNLNILPNSRNPLKVTIDRIDSFRGYSKNNVVISSYAANCGKGNICNEKWLEILELIRIGLKNKKS